MYTTEHLPIFALRDDSIVEIQGDMAGVHKAVELIALHLRKFLVDRSIVGVFETQVISCYFCFFFYFQKLKGLTGQLIFSHIGHI